MHRIFDPQNTFWRTLAFLCDFVGLSLCFLLCCLPVVTCGAAACALYDAVYHGLRRGDEIRVYARFFSTFRRELKTGVLATLPFLALGVVCGICWRVAFLVAVGGSDLAGVLTYAYRVIFFLAAVLWVTAMALLSRFEFRTGPLLLTAFRLALSRPLPFLAAAALLVGGWTLMNWWFISLFFAPALLAYLCTFPLEALFAPYLPQQEELDEPDET